MRKKGSLCVKFLAENWTRLVVVRTRVWITAHKTRTLANTSASGCRACCSQLTKTASWKYRNHLLKIHRPSAENAETICWKYRNHLLKIQKPSAENAETICWKYRNHLLKTQKPSAISSLFSTCRESVKSQLVVRPLINYFRLFPSLSARLPFACRHLVCLILST